MSKDVNLEMLKNFVVTEPTEEELRGASATWLSRVGPCLINNWPEKLAALSCPTRLIELPKDSTSLFERETFAEIGPRLAEQIDAVTGFDRYFFRLTSRSPKDAMWPLENLVTCSGKEMVNVIASSERCLDDLCYFRWSSETPYLALREFWYDVSPQIEFRVFVREGRILAAAEYFNRSSPVLPEFTAEGDEKMRARIDRYFDEAVLPALHIQTVVVDVVSRRTGFAVLEINPFGLSDPVGARDYAAIETGIPSIARLPRA